MGSAAERFNKLMSDHAKRCSPEGSEMELNFQFTNAAGIQPEDQAKSYLERLGFFESEHNTKLFEEGRIRVYNEPWAMECLLIQDIKTGQAVFVDLRSL